MISFQCSCGAKYQAKDSKSGSSFTCQKCGSKVAVPAAESEENFAETEILTEQSSDLEEEAEAPAPRLPRKAKKKKKAEIEDAYVPPSYEQMTLEERAAMRTSQTMASRSKWADLFTGDIRGIVVGGASILLGLFFVVFAFIMPGWLAADFGRDRSLEEVASMTRNERTGTSVLGSIYNTFGHTGLMIFMIVIGIAIIGGGIWFMKNYQPEDND